jgi:23S rRNA (uracil1939-C5)-methyltransferase
MPAQGDLLSLVVERPAVGGPMIARADGQIVLVTGAIPGERVQARIDRVVRSVAFATTVEVRESSPDRRAPFRDPSCGGCGYSHIAYARQLEIKSQVIADAFARIGHVEWPLAIPVAASREDGYRLRARLHVRGGHLGFFREGTHDVCDPRPSRQLLPEACDALDRLMASARSLGDLVREVELSENIAANERVVHVESSRPVDRRALDALTHGEGLTPGPYVTDELLVADQLPEREASAERPGGAPIRLRRHVLSFFQGNRYLIRDLVDYVVRQVPTSGRVLDLYAGAGLFSVAAATMADARVTAVEGDRMAAQDLAHNARAAGEAGRSGGFVEVVTSDVESFVAACARDARGSGEAFTATIVDPPRTGLSRAALDGLLALTIPKLVYVSCDVATLARDSRAIVEAGYRVTRVDAFDMFPNTPHVETVVVFDRTLG